MTQRTENQYSQRIVKNVRRVNRKRSHGSHETVSNPANTYPKEYQWDVTSEPAHVV